LFLSIYTYLINVVRQWIVLELSLRNLQVSCVGVLITLVRIELVEGLLLVVLGPPTIRWTSASINAGTVSTNRCESATLLEGRLSHIHTAWVSETVRLTSTILWTETILHQFFVILCSNLGSRTRGIGTTKVGDTRSRVTVVRELHIVAITLETSWILWHRLGWNKTLRAIVTKAIGALTSLRTVRGSHSLLVARPWDSTRHTLRTPSYCGETRGEVRGGLWFIVGQLTNDRCPTTRGIRSWTRTAWKCCETVLTNVDGVHTEHLLETTLSWGIGTNTEAWTNQLLLNWGEVVHTTRVVHTVSHIKDLLATTPLLATDVGKTCHFRLRSHFDTWLKVIFNELWNFVINWWLRCLSNLFNDWFWLRLIAQSSASEDETSNGCK
jgi:hypothetical protein